MILPVIGIWRGYEEHDQEGLKYQKLYNWAHTLITSGVIKSMDKFPSETSLQKKFGYSRQTVRTALQQLEEEGLITRVRGSGTYCVLMRDS